MANNSKLPGIFRSRNSYLELSMTLGAQLGKGYASASAIGPLLEVPPERLSAPELCQPSPEYCLMVKSQNDNQNATAEDT